MSTSPFRMLRLHAKPAVSSADWENCSFTLDIILDHELRIRTRLAYFGIWGAIGSDDPRPFVLTSDGSIDFGGGFEGDDRFASTNLLTKIIRVDEYFTFIKEDEELTLRIAKVTDLNE